MNNKMAKNTNRTAKESLNMTDDAMCVCVLNLIHTPSLYISTYTYIRMSECTDSAQVEYNRIVYKKKIQKHSHNILLFNYFHFLEVCYLEMP